MAMFFCIKDAGISPLLVNEGVASVDTVSPAARNVESRPMAGVDADPNHIVVDTKLTIDPLRAYQKLCVKQVVQKVHPLNPATPISEDKIRFVCLSDTHNQIEDLASFVSDEDVLLHAGDFTMVGIPKQVAVFNRFLGTLPHKVKIVIAGNHDMTFDTDSIENRRGFLRLNFYISQRCFEEYLRNKGLDSVRQLLTNCVYLEDSSVQVCGINIYGAPWVPEFCQMGFNVPRGQPLLDKWNLIPSDTDILITHGPPLGRGDYCVSGDRAGCLELLNTIQKRVKPMFHVFGHIHEGYGMTTDNHTTFINASNCTIRYDMTNPAVVFDVPVPPGHSKEELLHLPEPVIHAKINNSPELPTEIL